MPGIEQQLPSYLVGLIASHPGEDLLEGVGTMIIHRRTIAFTGHFSANLRPVSFLEVINDQLFNLEEIAIITQIPLSKFRSGEELAYKFKNKIRTGITIFHLSSGGISSQNSATGALFFSTYIPVLDE